MNDLLRLHDRLVPPLLMAASVMLLAAGLLSYVPSALGDRAPSPSAIAAGDPLFTPTGAPSTAGGSPSPTPIGLSATPAPRPSATAVPAPRSASPGPSSSPAVEPPAATPTPPAGIASRIRIASLGIDLPVVSGDLVVRGNRDLYPLCDVAMFLPEFVQPGNAGTTYIYAHAQRGMFLPLLRASQDDDGARMLGALVEVYTTANELHLYEISRVKRHATDLSLADVPPGTHRLVLQTSEGPTGTIPKLQVAARPLSVAPAEPREANPRPRPRVCLPG